MPAQITELITGKDVAETVRDMVAAILVVEIENQKALAQVAGQNPDDWDLEVYLERANPFESWLEQDDNEQPDRRTPIVNVWLESTNQEGAASAVDGKAATSTINVDCFGYGVSKETLNGHEAGDRKAAFEAQRALRLCRRILFSGQYTYLGSPRKAGQFIGGRKLLRLETFQPEQTVQTAQRIVGARMAIEVRHTLDQPQVLGETIETITVEVTRTEDDRVLVNTAYGVAPD